MAKSTKKTSRKKAATRPRRNTKPAVAAVRPQAELAMPMGATALAVPALAAPAAATMVVADASVRAALAPFARECPPFEPQPIPKPDTRSSIFIPVPGHENFAGGGYADRASTRPAGLFGLAAKFHDFGYTCNDLEFFRGPRCAKEYSRFAKMDFIFLTLNKQVWDRLRVDSRLSDWLAGIAFRGHVDHFLADDGFVNPLNDAGLDDPDDYLMFPYDVLPAPRPMTTEQRVEPRFVNGHFMGNVVRTVTVPDYNAVTDYDRQNAWRTWIETVYTSPLWRALSGIDAGTDGSFRLP